MSTAPVIEPCLESSPSSPCNKVFAIGDLHLSFSSEKPMGIFGSNWDDHHQKIESNWRASVSENDIVLLLGDLSWGLKFGDAKADIDWIKNLPGRKVLLKGNHDLWWQSVTRLREHYPNMFFLQNDSLVFDFGPPCEAGAVQGKSARVAVCGSRGWITPQEPSFSEGEDRKIYDRELIRLRLSLEAARKQGAGHIIACLHFAPSARPEIRSGFMELFEEHEVDQVVYGHLHGREAYKKGLRGYRAGIEYLLVSADFVDFAPFLVYPREG